MNSFGRILRLSIFGESHGDCVGVVLDGCPPGLEISEEEMLRDLERRQGGKKGTTPRKEPDLPVFRSGVFNGKTTGAPLLILFENTNIQSKDYNEIRFVPRPGHADMTAWQKYRGFNDYRGGGHFSGRLTAGIVAVGSIAKQILYPVTVAADITDVGGSENIEQAVTTAINEKDSIGGTIECRVAGVPAGWGEPFFDSVESVLSHAIFSIPGIKGIEFGAGFAAARMKGSGYNDEILDIQGTTRTNNSGGINGGITNGNPLVFRVAVRPTASIDKKQRSIDVRTGEPIDIGVGGRHDVCIALRMPVIVEAVTALVLADFMLINKAYGSTT